MSVPRYSIIKMFFLNEAWPYLDPSEGEGIVPKALNDVGVVAGSIKNGERCRLLSHGSFTILELQFGREASSKR